MNRFVVLYSDVVCSLDFVFLFCLSIIWFDKTQILESLTKMYHGNTTHNGTDAIVASIL